MTGLLEEPRSIAGVFHVAPSIAIIGVELNARTQLRQFATGCDYLNLPKPLITLFPNTRDEFRLRQDWQKIIHEALKSGQQTPVVQDRISSILPVPANEQHHAHFVIETTTATFSFDDLIMDGMPSLTRCYTSS